jgi:hypothetical protein
VAWVESFDPRVASFLLAGLHRLVHALKVVEIYVLASPFDCPSMKVLCVPSVVEQVLLFEREIILDYEVLDELMASSLGHRLHAAFVYSFFLV